MSGKFTSGLIRIIYRRINHYVLGYNNNNDTNGDDGSEGDGETASNGKNMLARKLSTKGDTLYLERRVGLFSGVALIVGTMIGKQYLLQ